MTKRIVVAASLIGALALAGCSGGGASPPETHTIAGTTSGLVGTGLMLQLNGANDLPVSSAPRFAFATALERGTAYSVTVKTQPSSPTQTCTVLGGSGVVGATNVESVRVECVTNTYSVGGNTSGVLGTGLVLQLNGSTDLPVSRSGAFSFSSPVASGATYAVSVVAQPVNPSQTCAVARGTGTVNNVPIVDVAVTCETNTYAVGGTVTGLGSGGLVLSLNGGADVPIGASGRFTFPERIASGGTYTVTVRSHPAALREICVVDRSSGLVTASDVGDVSVRCATHAGLAFVLDGTSTSIRSIAIEAQGGLLLPAASTDAQGGQVYGLAVSPDRTVLFVSNVANATLSAFAIDRDKGRLTPLGLVVSTGVDRQGASDIAVSPSGRYLYAANRYTRTIGLFAFDEQQRSLQPGSVVATLAGSGYYGIALRPDGRFLYVLTGDNGSEPVLTTYAVDDTTGGLTAVSTLDVPNASSGPVAAPNGRFLYVPTSKEVTLDVPSGEIRPFALDAASGVPSALPAGPSVGSNGGRLAVHPSGRFAYLLDNYNFISDRDNHVDAFALDDSTGAIARAGSPLLVGATPFGIACDASGQFLLVGASGLGGRDTTGTWYDLTSFRIDQGTGGLTRTDRIGPHTSRGELASLIAVVD